jgi:hypothetical protein
MANALPVEQFGLVILLHTYIMVIKGFVNFRTFEAIVRFGIPIHDRGDEGKFKSLLCSTVVVDLRHWSHPDCAGRRAVATWALHWGARLVSGPCGIRWSC